MPKVIQDLKKYITPYIEKAMWVILPIALACNAIVFSGDTLPSLAFFHVNPTFAFVLYLFVLLSWFVMYFSSGLKLLNDKNNNDKILELKTTLPFEAIGLLNVVLNGFTLMGGIAAFMTFCEVYGILSVAFLHSNLLFISGFFFTAGLIASYSLTYQRIRKVGDDLTNNVKEFNDNPLRLSFAFMIAVFAGFSSALFAVYCTPIVALFHIIVPWQAAAARLLIALLAFISAFSLYFVSLNFQLKNAAILFEKFKTEGFKMKVSPNNILFAIISVVAATAFCFTSYHQFSILFTITNANRSFIIAEVCCQWVAFVAAYFDSYQTLASEVEKCMNVVFILEHLVISVLALYTINCFIIPSLVPVIGYGLASLAGGFVFLAVTIVDHYIDDELAEHENIQNKTTSHADGCTTSHTDGCDKRTTFLELVVGERAQKVFLSPARRMLSPRKTCNQYSQQKQAQPHTPGSN